MAAILILFYNQSFFPFKTSAILTAFFFFFAERTSKSKQKEKLIKSFAAQNDRKGKWMQKKMFYLIICKAYIFFFSFYAPITKKERKNYQYMNRDDFEYEL